MTWMQLWGPVKWFRLQLSWWMKRVIALEKKTRQWNWKMLIQKFLFWIKLYVMSGAAKSRIHCNPLRFNNSFFYSFPPSHLLMRYAVFCFRSLYLDINLFHDLMFQVSLVLSRCLAPLDVLYTVYMNTYNTKICFDFYETLLLWLAKNTWSVFKTGE